MDARALRDTIQQAVALLVGGDTRGLAQLSGGIRFSAKELEEAAAGYPGRLEMPPAGWLDVIAPTPEDRAAFAAGVRPQYFVDVRLWDEDAPEPRPSLVLELLLSEGAGGQYTIEVCDLYVE